MIQPSKSPTVDDLAMEYLLGAEAGLPPDLNSLATRLPDSDSQEELREIVEAAEIARSTFPVPFRLRTVIAGRYQLLEELGSGGFGKVWRARDQKLGRDVALKLFHPLMNDAQVESTLRRERDALARVHHDGIVRLLDSGTHEDAQFLAMEYLPGSTLDKVLERLCARGDKTPGRAAVAAAIGGPPATGEQSWLEDDWHRTTARIMVGVLWAVAAAHAHRIHHRDLKPGNILLRPSGRPVVLDFGLAGLGDMAQGTLTGRLFGTVAYMAPEQLEVMRTGKDARTDIYQLGLVLYEMLTFQRTFAGKERTSLLEAVRRSRIPSPRQLKKDIPAPLADICMRALERDPNRRYASADAFRDDLEKWLAGQVPSVSRLGAAGRGLRLVRRFTVSHRAAVLATALLTLTTGTALWYMLRPEAAIDAKKLEGDSNSYAVTMREPGWVCALRNSLDASGNTIGINAVHIRVGSGNPGLLVRLDSGTTTVQIVEAKDYSQLPGEEGTKVCWIADATNKWEGLCKGVADAADRNQKPVTNEEVIRINGELDTKGARGGSSRSVPIEELRARLR
ncbi:MAG TPA: serine/threonine-protein kinase [Planctomycetota bacterium]|nr:serine/threonine-protein kinase [Planctomycetota bacterium]